MTRTDIHYTLHENGIYEFRFEKASRKSVDELYEVLEKHLFMQPYPDSVLLLIDTTNGIYPPLRHLFSATQEFNRKYKDAPPGYTAVLSNPNVLLSLTDAFMRTLSKFTTGYNSLRFFKEEQRDEAIAWLLSIAEQQSKS